MLLAGLTVMLYGGMAAVAGRMSVGTLQCVSVPDPTVALAFDEIGRNLNINEQWLLLSES